MDSFLPKRKKTVPKRRYGFAEGGMASSDESMPDSGEGSNEICVPMDEVMVQGVPPSVGDTVQIPAKVTRIEGDNVYAEPEGMGEKNQPESLEQEGARLKAAAVPPQDTENQGY